MLSVRYIREFWSHKCYRFDCTGLYHLIQGDRWTSKAKITSFTCHSVYLEWTNGWITFASEGLSVSITSVSSFWRSRSMASIFHTREIDWQTEDSVMEQILQKFPSSPEKPGEPHMRKQCVPDTPSFRAPGNKAIWVKAISATVPRQVPKM